MEITSRFGFSNLDTTYFIKDKSGATLNQIKINFYNGLFNTDAIDIDCSGKYKMWLLIDKTINKGHGYDMAMKLPSGSSINSSQDWRTGTPNNVTLVKYDAHASGSDPSVPHFMNEGWKYMGFKLEINGKEHHGWIKLRITADISSKYCSLEISEYAYEDEADKAIKAGDTGAGISSISAFSQPSDFSVYPNPSSGVFRIEFKYTIGATTLEVLNGMGQVVYSNNDYMSNDEIFIGGSGWHTIRLTNTERVVNKIVLIE
ncbi:MAG: hypothetical protein CL840_07455 [Crocinitomicaceae bacterium]|nr:hypothetical protein [Crocinitomicaceae bacterium]